jgi:spermidine synthase
MTSKSLWSLAVAVIASNLCHANASTYQLNYDGIISPKVMENHFSSDVADTITKLVASSINGGTGTGTTSTSTSSSLDVMKQLQIECFPQKYFGRTATAIPEIIGTKCVADHRRSGFSFGITTSVYATDEGSSIMIDATIQSTDAENDDTSRDSLVNAVFIIDENISNDGDDLNAVWNVQERAMPRRNNQPSLAKPMMNASPLASIEKRILSKDDIKDRTQIFSSVENDDHKARVDIWEYKSIDGNDNESYRDLFLDSTLRATTDAAGKAHAEAFVHPTLIAHVVPKRVAVISDMPVAIVKEILKYQSVTDITVVGANHEAIDAVKLHMSQLNDCSLIENVADSCIDDTRVELVSDDVSTWIGQKVDELEEVDYFTYCEVDKCDSTPSYDIILVDASSAEQVKELFSQDFYAKLVGITTYDSFLVFNAGSGPSLNSSHDDYTYRDDLILASDRYSNDMELWDVTMIYEEPAAGQLNTAFIMKIGLYSNSYSRFTRQTPTAMDLDIVRRMHPQQLPQTKFYDGVTHIRYLRPSKTWENWFCRSIHGKGTPNCALLKDWFDPSKHGHKTKIGRDTVIGRSLLAAEDIPKGSFILGDDTNLHLHLDGFQWEALNSFVEDFPDAKEYKTLRDFFISYGFQNEPIGLTGWSVSIASNNTFTNHGCAETDWNVGAFPYTKDPEILYESDLMFAMIWNRRPQLGMATAATRDIKEGETIMMDYSTFRTLEDPKFTKFLQDICDTGIGLIDSSDAKTCIDNDTSCS